jgi:hypothetical protein
MELKLSLWAVALEDLVEQIISQVFYYKKKNAGPLLHLLVANSNRDHFEDAINKLKNSRYLDCLKTYATIAAVYFNPNEKVD